MVSVGFPIFTRTCVCVFIKNQAYEYFFFAVVVVVVVTLITASVKNETEKYLYLCDMTCFLNYADLFLKISKD